MGSEMCIRDRRLFNVQVTNTKDLIPSAQSCTCGRALSSEQGWLKGQKCNLCDVIMALGAKAYRCSEPLCHQRFCRLCAHDRPPAEENHKNSACAIDGCAGELKKDRHNCANILCGQCKSMHPMNKSAKCSSCTNNLCLLCVDLFKSNGERRSPGSKPATHLKPLPRPLVTGGVLNDAFWYCR